MKNFKILPKTFIYTVSILGSVVVLAHLIFYLIFPNVYIEQQKEEVRKSADILVRSLEGKEISVIRDELIAYSKNINVAAHLRRDIENGTFSLTHDLDIKEDTFDNHLLIEERELTTKDGEHVYVQVVLNKDIKTRFIKMMNLTIPVIACITLIFSVIFSYFYSKRIVSPLLHISRVTKKMEQMDNSVRFNTCYGDEFGDVCRQIDNLYEKLISVIDDLERKNENICRMQKQKVSFLRGASHELKTPLTSLRIMSENMLFNIGRYKDHEKYLKKSIVVIDNMDSLLKEVLDSSKFQEWTENKNTIQMSSFIRNILGKYEELYLSKNIKLTYEIIDDFKVDMNKKALDKVICNIISNAIKYSYFEGKVNIYLSNNSLIVDNTCQPLTSKELSNLFKIFFHSNTIESNKNRGSGLGLYIVKNILDSYNYTYSLEPIDEGMRFSINFNECKKEN